VGLEDDFASFRSSPESRKPAFEVREDWREWQYEQAVLNGDMRADQNPDTSVTDSWSEPDFEELESPEEEGLELVTKLSKKPQPLKDLNDSEGFR